jgi:dipeptidyl aminopeptidase/acylaminoacyl peptidase
MPSARIVSWKAGDGRDIEGVLILPHGYRAGTRLPTIARMHGGPEGTNMPAFSPEVPFPDPSLESYPHVLYAARGYATLLPNFRGSGGYGESFRRAAQMEWSEGFFDDVMKGVDSLVEQGIADPERLVIGGYWRSGATKVVSTIGRTQRFKAATILSAYPDFVELYNARDDFHLQHEGLMGGSPASAPEAYRKHAPIHLVGEIRTPAMVVHDERDFAIRSTQAMAMHGALLEKNVPGELVLYRGLDRHAEAELIRRLLAFYDRWVR